MRTEKHLESDVLLVARAQEAHIVGRLTLLPFKDEVLLEPGTVLNAQTTVSATDCQSVVQQPVEIKIELPSAVVERLRFKISTLRCCLS